MRKDLKLTGFDFLETLISRKSYFSEEINDVLMIFIFWRLDSIWRKKQIAYIQLVLKVEFSRNHVSQKLKTAEFPVDSHNIYYNSWRNFFLLGVWMLFKTETKMRRDSSFMQNVTLWLCLWCCMLSSNPFWAFMHLSIILACRFEYPMRIGMILWWSHIDYYKSE